MKKCIINQPCGLGDILLTIKVGCFYAEKGYEVIWPVEPIYRNLQKNITTNQKISFPCVHDAYEGKMRYETLTRTEVSNVTEIDNALYVPIRRGFHSDSGTELRRDYGHDEANMISKFSMCGLDYDGWQDYFSINRNPDREARLMEKIGIVPGDSIHLVNDEFGTPPRWREKLSREIVTPNNLKRVNLRIVDGFDLFDWVSVFERAEKIDTVSTSNFYVFEKIDLKCKPTVYSRNVSDRSYEHNWGWMEKISLKEYEFIN
jgi:hypothetical protein